MHPNIAELRISDKKYTNEYVCSDAFQKSSTSKIGLLFTFTYRFSQNILKSVVHKNVYTTTPIASI